MKMDSSLMYLTREPQSTPQRRHMLPRLPLSMLPPPPMPLRLPTPLPLPTTPKWMKS